MSDNFPKRGAGGTPGGLGTFFLGLVMSLIGGYMLTNLIQVRSSFWGYRIGFGGVGISAFSVTLIIFLFGVFFVFYDADSKIGWALSAASLLFMLIGVIANLNVYFVSTPLYVTLIIFTLLIGGIGLMLRSLRAT